MYSAKLFSAQMKIKNKLKCIKFHIFFQYRNNFFRQELLMVLVFFHQFAEHSFEMNLLYSRFNYLLLTAISSISWNILNFKDNENIFRYFMNILATIHFLRVNNVWGERKIWQWALLASCQKILLKRKPYSFFLMNMKQSLVLFWYTWISLIYKMNIVLKYDLTLSRLDYFCVLHSPVNGP